MRVGTLRSCVRSAQMVPSSQEVPMHLCHCSENRWALQTQNPDVSGHTTVWQAGPFVWNGNPAEPRTSREDVCRDLGFLIRGLSGLWVPSLGKSLEACAPGAAAAQPEGAAASAGSQTPSCCLGNVFFRPEGSGGGEGRQDSFTNTGLLAPVRVPWTPGQGQRRAGCGHCTLTAPLRWILQTYYKQITFLS